MKIVSETGPIIGLDKIGRIFLLKELATEVIIPPYVHRELYGKIGTETDQIDQALRDFIQVAELGQLEVDIEEALIDLETFEKCQFLFKFKEGDNFNQRNTLSISRIKI